MPAMDIDRVDAVSLASQVNQLRHRMSGLSVKSCPESCPAVVELLQVKKQLQELTSVVMKLSDKVMQPAAPAKTFSQAVRPSSVLSFPQPWVGCQDVSNDGIACDVIPQSKEKAVRQTPKQPFNSLANASTATHKKQQKRNYVIGARTRNEGSTSVRKATGKYTSVFVSRLDVETTGSQILDDLKANGVAVDFLHCEKLQTRFPGYASFRIHGRCSDPDALLSPDLWDEGVFVKWYKVRQDRTSLNGRGEGKKSANGESNINIHDAPTGSGIIANGSAAGATNEA